MVPLTESVTLAFFEQYIDDEGIFNASEASGKAADIMLHELIRWTAALKPLRGN
ncbi:hypothetical protein [Spirosoma jeollabukense]